jgi:CubicO group peptidase (beta-lactamase class C family)
MQNHVLTRRELLAAGVLIGAAGCLPLRREAHTSTFDWTSTQPEAAGMSRAGLEAVRAAIQKHIDANEITGAVTAVARHGKLAWYESQGVRDIATGAPMRKDDLFRMMSSTKPITATAVLMMMEEGKLSLEDEVSRFIPTFKGQKVAVAPPGAKDASEVKLVPAERGITIKDLLTHTSGLSSAGEGTAPAAGSLVNKMERKPDDTLADYIPQLGAAALDFQPGTRWRYSPVDGFDTLLRIVEITSGQPGDVFLRERLFEPLDMHDTYFNVPPEKQARVVPLYERKDGRWQPKAHILDGGSHKYLYGAGGLFSTAHDFMQWELMLLNAGALNGKRVLKPETVALMSRNHVGSMFAEWIPAWTAGNGFGLGVRVLEDASKGSGRSVGAFGWGGAYGTESWADPQLELAAAIFIQQPVPTVLPDFQQAVRAAVVS